MPIKVQCGNCSASFQAKDELVGRRVKCPECKAPIKIGQAAAAPAKSAVPAAAAHNPLLDLLEEENVRAMSRGPVCENCRSEIPAGAKICVECGFDQETGQILETHAAEDEVDAGAESTMSDAERIMAKAERDIEDLPVSSDQQNFGDGAESYMIAIVCGVIGVVLIAVGLAIILMMDTIGEYVASSAISFIASIGLYIAMGIWITAVAFTGKPAHAIACICTAFIYCAVFGFMQGKTLLMPTIVLLASAAIGLASGIYTMYNGWKPPSDSHLILEYVQMFGMG